MEFNESSRIGLYQEYTVVNHRVGAVINRKQIISETIVTIAFKCDVDHACRRSLISDANLVGGRICQYGWVGELYCVLACEIPGSGD